MAMKPGSLFLFVLLLAFCVAARAVSAQPQRGQTVVPGKPAGVHRVALVIGNAAYAVGPLANPVNDARAMAKMLRECGFEVISGENQSRGEMLRAIEAFRQKLRPGADGLFYFAGHGLQIKGENYLIPIGARIEAEIDVEVEGVQLKRVLNEMSDAQSRVNIIILDACRNNPFPRSSRSAAGGLGQVNAPSGMLIAYATAPDSTASDGSAGNGLYTRELLTAIRTPGLMVEQVFKRVRERVEAKSRGAQTPWENSSLKGDFYFVPGNAPVATPVSSEVPTDINPISSPGEPRTTAYRPIEDTKSVFVPADAGWTSTGLMLKPGQQVDLNAGNSIHLDRITQTEAGGLPRFDPRNPLPSCQSGALLARIGNIAPVCIRAKGALDVTHSGELQLGVNDHTLQDNRGGFNVTITVRGALQRN
ncbi:MAG: caspase family protein [Blastocatellia bacterium]